MADISAFIRRKSLKAKEKAAIRTIKAQAKDKIRQVRIDCAEDPEMTRAVEEQHEQAAAHREQRRMAKLAYMQKQPRQFTVGEDIVNAITHGIGAGLSIAAIVLLILHAVALAPVNMKGTYIVSYVLFGSSLFIMYMMSTLYHALTPYGARKLFSILTHDAIYLLIAGTYTPYVLTTLGGTSGWITFGVVWGVVVVLITLYSVFGRKLRSFSIASYLIIGWLFIVLFAVTPIAHYIPTASKVLLITGGLSYTVGALFFLMPKYKWTHTIFHIFALGGSVLHFFSVWTSI